MSKEFTQDELDQMRTVYQKCFHTVSTVDIFEVYGDIREANGDKWVKEYEASTLSVLIAVFASTPEGRAGLTDFVQTLLDNGTKVSLPFNLSIDDDKIIFHNRGLCKYLCYNCAAEDIQSLSQSQPAKICVRCKSLFGNFVMKEDSNEKHFKGTI